MLSLVVVLGGFLAHSAAGAPATVELRKGTVLRFATAKEARSILGAKDEFIDRLSEFERSVMLKSVQPVSTGEFLTFVAAQAEDWTESEMERMSPLIQSVGAKIHWMTVSLPEEVLLIKTSENVEGGNPHTRSNAVILPRAVSNVPDEVLEKIILHELFHVLSRYHPELRESLYSIVGFRMCKEIELPASLHSRRITNPDAPSINVAIEVEFENRQLLVAPILLSSVTSVAEAMNLPFPVGFLDFRLLEIQEVGDRCSPKLSQGEPILHMLTDVKGYIEKTGQNTQYIIHPEEILADNFVLVANAAKSIPSERIVKELQGVLAR